MNPGYGFHPEAENDFTDIWDFIAADSPDAADRVTDEIVARLEGLVKFPHQGHRRTDLTTHFVTFLYSVETFNSSTRFSQLSRKWR
jgi:plasmid stabilization system protein ParE